MKDDEDEDKNSWFLFIALLGVMIYGHYKIKFGIPFLSDESVKRK